MRRTFSSNLTFVFKYLLPAVWIAGFGLGTAQLFIDRGDVVFDGVQRGAPPFVPWLFLGMFALGSIILLRIAVPLRTLVQEGDELVVSDYLRSVRFPPGMINEVRQNRWLNIRPVTVTLRADVPVAGRRFSFLPPMRLRFRASREDPGVAELRQLAGVTSQGRVHVSHR